MREFIAASGVLWCIITYWLGGQEIPFINQGFKWIRRFAMPIGMFFILWYLGSPVILGAIACALLCLGTHLGYRNKVWLYALTGLAMGLPALLLSQFTLTSLLISLIPCLVHTGLGYLSLRLNKFSWSFVALAMGWAIGVTYVYQVY